VSNVTVTMTFEKVICCYRLCCFNIHVRSPQRQTGE